MNQHKFDHKNNDSTYLYKHIRQHNFDDLSLNILEQIDIINLPHVSNELQTKEMNWIKIFNSVSSRPE